MYKVFEIIARMLCEQSVCFNKKKTRQKPVGYVFSMAVGTYWGMVETGPFFVRGRTVDSEGGGAAGRF